MILIENNHICCLQYQTKILWGSAQLFLTDPRSEKCEQGNINPISPTPKFTLGIILICNMTTPEKKKVFTF